MKIRTAMFIAIISVTLTACGKPTIDSTTEASYHDSLEKVKASLPPEQNEAFNDAVKEIVFGDITNMKDLLAMANRDPTEAIKKLHGLNAIQILAKAAEVKEQRTIKQIAAIKDELAELDSELSAIKQRKSLHEESLAAITEQIQVSKTTLKWIEASYRDRLELKLTVTNGTDTPLSSISARGTLATPGRSIPWLVEEFNFDISGGLEPGESKSWNLSPNTMMSGWSKAPKDREDTVFTVEIIDADGPDNESILAEKFNEYDQKEMDRLQERHDSLIDNLQKLESEKS